MSPITTTGGRWPSPPPCKTELAQQGGGRSCSRAILSGNFRGDKASFVIRWRQKSLKQGPDEETIQVQWQHSSGEGAQAQPFTALGGDYPEMRTRCRRTLRRLSAFLHAHTPCPGSHRSWPPWGSPQWSPACHQSNPARPPDRVWGARPEPFFGVELAGPGAQVYEWTGNRKGVRLS